MMCLNKIRQNDDEYFLQSEQQGTETKVFPRLSNDLPYHFTRLVQLISCTLLLPRKSF